MGSELTPLVITLWVLNVLVDSGGQLAFKVLGPGVAPTSDAQTQAVERPAADRLG